MSRRGIQLSTSEHAKQRIRERMGIEGKIQIKETVKKAYNSGLCMKKHYIPKSTLWWVDKKVNRNYFGRCSRWTIYKGFLFLFTRDLTLVTVIEMPKNLIPRKELARY